VNEFFYGHSIVFLYWFHNRKESTYVLGKINLLVVLQQCWYFLRAFEGVENSIFCLPFGSCMMYKGTASEN